MTTEMKGFFLLVQSYDSFTSFCLQIQYAFSFTIYFLQYHSHQWLTVLLSSRDTSDGDECQYLS